MTATFRRAFAGVTLAVATLGVAPVFAGPETSPTITCRYSVQLSPESRKALAVTIPDKVCDPANATVAFVWDKISHNHNESILRG